MYSVCTCGKHLVNLLPLMFWKGDLELCARASYWITLPVFSPTVSILIVSSSEGCGMIK